MFSAEISLPNIYKQARCLVLHQFTRAHRKYTAFSQSFGIKIALYQKKEVQATFPGYDESCTTLFLRKLNEDFNISYRKMSNVRVCLFFAKENRQMLDSQLPERKKLPTATATIADFEDA